MKRKIEEMSNWDILTYLRIEQNWMVQSHYEKGDIEDMGELEFTVEEWEDFTDFACNCFDHVKSETMYAIIEEWKNK